MLATKSYNSIKIAGLVVTAFFFGGLAVSQVLAAAYVAPSATPPAGTVPQPIFNRRGIIPVTQTTADINIDGSVTAGGPVTAVGSSMFSGLRLNGQDGGINQVWQSNAGKVLGFTANGGDIVFGQTSTQQVVIKPSGYLGIGIAAPLSALHVHGNYLNSGNGGITLDANDGNNYQLQINPFVVGGSMVGYQFKTKSVTGGTAVPLTFDNAGNVGINKVNPAAALDVAGSIKATGCVGHTFVGKTSLAGGYDGSLNGAASNGYVAANAICAAAYAGSRVCQASEILESIACSGPTDPIRSVANNGPAWVFSGPPGFTSLANDCQAFTSNSQSPYQSFGRVWSFESVKGGQAFLAHCHFKNQFACCK